MRKQFLQEEALSAQYLLRQFRTELADVKLDNDIRIEIGDFAKFADFFFDGLIADWCMQTHINNSQENVTQVRNQVQEVIGKLILIKEQETMHRRELEKEMDNLVMDS